MRSIGDRIFTVCNSTFLVFMAVVTLFPMWRVLSISFSSMEEAMRGGAFLWPRGFTTQAFQFVLQSEYIWIAYRNSIFITAVGCIVAVLFTATTSYPLIKLGLPFRKALLYGILFTMLFNGGIIPTYLLIKGVGLLDSLWSLILPNAISAFNVIIMMSFFRTIPAELEESAMIDGANPIRVFFQIIMSLSKPVLATIALWEAVGLWNNYLQAIFYLNDKSNYILPVLLKDIITGQELAQMTGELTGSSTDSVISATIVLAILPIICVYPFLQKYFVKGTLIGSVKG
jgi:putative aldouronate transport system permease protein